MCSNNAVRWYLPAAAEVRAEDERETVEIENLSSLLNVARSTSSHTMSYWQPFTQHHPYHFKYSIINRLFKAILIDIICSRFLATTVISFFEIFPAKILGKVIIYEQHTTDSVNFSSFYSFKLYVKCVKLADLRY